MIPHTGGSDQQSNDIHAVAFRTYLRTLLAGGNPNGTPPSAFGEWQQVVEVLHEAYAAGGMAKVREYWNDYVRRHPEAAEMASGDPSEPEHKVRWTADELLTAEFPPIQWVVPGVFPEGLTFLAGRPKIGKSLLALQLAHAVSSGGKIFDQAVEQGPVLYLAYEDSARRLQKRMQEQSWPAHTKAVFCTAWEPLDQGGLVSLQQAMIEEGYGLVIIDTLSRAISGKRDQNSASDMTMVLSTLQRLALDLQASIHIIDHHHKARGESPDPVDNILGSIAKGGVADCVAGLYRERGKSGATLHITGRDLDGDKKLALEWDARLACWKYLGDADEVAKNSVQDAILAAFRFFGGRATTAEVAEHLGKDRGLISREIAELVEKGELIQAKKDGKSQPYEIPGMDNSGSASKES
jgi:AAA domain